MEVGNDISECNNEGVEKPGNKTRLSLFLPAELTMSETKTNFNNDDYIQKLKLEEETWKRLYKEEKLKKEYKINLLRKIKNEVKVIDYDLFDQEEIKYLNSGPDIAAFVKEAEELQNLVKIVNIQCKAKKEKLDTVLSSIEKACEDMTSLLST